MDLHAKDKTQHPENVELLSAQKPITDFKGLLTTIISAVAVSVFTASCLTAPMPTKALRC